MQYLDPVFKKLKNIDLFDISAIREMIGISIPWFLLCTYLFFHCFLNLVAELICFANRRFYDGKKNSFAFILDWWNAPSFDVFWRKWNLPTREFLLKHVYYESYVIKDFSNPLA
jgi:diacylglycerol O-acyltransferase-1